MRFLCGRRMVGISLVFGLVLTWLVFEKIRFGITELQISFAREQVELFSEMADKALSIKDIEHVRKMASAA